MIKNKIVCVCPVSLSEDISFPEKKIKSVKIKKNNTGMRLEGRKLINFLKDASIAIIGLEKISQSIVDQLPKLKGIVKYGVGEDNIDLKYLNKKKISYYNTKGVNNISVSELVLSYSLLISKKIIQNINQLKNKRKWGRHIGRDLKSMKVGIVGLGNIGSEVVKLFKFLSCEIYAYDILDRSSWCKKKKIKFTSLNEIKKKCDIISFHVPLTKKTKNIIDSSFLKGCKKNIIVINTSRGKIANLTHIKDFLTKNKNAYYATDVFPEEPWKISSIIKLDNFFSTPHIGGSTQQSINSMARASERNLLNMLKIMRK